MPRLILILAVGAVFYLLLRRVGSLPPHKRRAEYLKIAAGAAVVIVIGLTLAGKMHWIGAAVTGLLVFLRQSLPLLMRAFPFLSQLGRSAQASPRQSTVSTATLRMHLDHDSGALSGEVLAGPYKDWRLDELDRAQLDELRSYCAQNDPDALQLLDGYFEQRFSGEEQPRGNAGGSGGSSGNSGEMTRREALDVLGLGEDADRDAIIEAHRKLMQKLHPDRGGSDYLAAKINQAKDLLLGQ